MAELMTTGDIDKVTLVTSNQSGAKPKLDSHEKFKKVLTPAKQQSRLKIS